MRIPQFSVTQESDGLQIKIKAPYCDLKDLDISIVNECFMFYCKPYFLRLIFPGKLNETLYPESKFIADNQEFIFKVKKLNPNENFPDLDMLTKLLQPPSKDKNINLNKIDEISSNNSEDEIDSDTWYLEQELPNLTLNDKCYGFANKYSNYLENLQDSLFGILDNPNVINMSIKDRKSQRNLYENNYFDKSIYLYQFFNEHENITDIINFKSPWECLDIHNLSYTDYEIDILKELPNKSFLLTPNEENQVFLGLVDILLAYCYEKRSFLYENTVESGWAINKISATLSWFDMFDTIGDVLRSYYRRSLCFPLYRNYKLSEKIIHDLKLIITFGRKFILKCLLEIHQTFNMGSCTEPRYILNQLFIKDYCVFIQKCNYEKLLQIKNELDEIVITKDDLNLDLRRIELQAINEMLNDTDSSNSIDSDDDSIENDDDTENQNLENDISEIISTIKTNVVINTN